MDPVASGELQCRVGDEVYDVAEHKIGKVVAFDTRVLTVEHGLLRKDDYYIPVSAINACNGGKVYLNVAKERHRGSGLERPAGGADRGGWIAAHRIAGSRLRPGAGARRGENPDGFRNG